MQQALWHCYWTTKSTEGGCVDKQNDFEAKLTYEIVCYTEPSGKLTWETGKGKAISKKYLADYWMNHLW